jgi:hypothetical protein
MNRWRMSWPVTLFWCTCGFVLGPLGFLALLALVALTS